ncbi:MAG: SMC-Scp complex subunit ScpB [Chitinispirillaceae bacterium]|nr:SMC-Scp complex subunit ScpB [Chitinispirillaceae bacterium]
MMSKHDAEDVLDEPTGADGNDAGNEPAAGSAPDDLRIFEAVLFASDELMTTGSLKTILPGQPDARNIRRMVEKINIQLQKERHPFEIVEIGGGYQFRTITYYHPWVRQIFKEKAAKKLSVQALESLAIIAYKQPISKAEIEVIRGVISDGAMKTLLEKRLITVAGRSEKPGRPLLYGTTQTFLKYFGLNKIEDLPRIEEFEAMAREKMEELTIDELALPEAAFEEAAAVPGGQDKKESPAAPVAMPASSLFEVDVTAPEAAGTAEQSGEDEPSDFEIDAKAEKPVATEESQADTATVKPSESDEEVFEVDKKVPASDRAGGPEPDIPEQRTVAPPAAAEKEPVAVEGAALRSETAFDLEAIIPQDDTADEAPAAVHEKREPAIVEGAALRGETAFDLEAIVIEEPVIKMPAVSAKVEKSPAPATDNDKEEAFEVKETPAEDTAGPARGAVDEDSAAFEVKETGPEKEAPFNLEDAIEEVAPEKAAAIGDAEPAFEPAEPVSKKAAKLDFEDAVDALAAETPAAVDNEEGEALFEQKPAGASSKKPADTDYFEVRGPVATPAGSAEECEKLAEALKETVIIKPEKPKKTSSVKAGGSGNTTAGRKTTRKKSAGTAEKKSDGKPPVKTNRARRTSSPGATGTP